LNSPAKQGARAGGLSPASWIAAQNLFAQGFGLLLFAIQAPLLGPRAFGLITLVMVFLGFVEWVLEISSTDALVSVRHIDAQHYATMTTANALLAGSIGIVVFVCANPIARLFHEPELASILRWMSPLPLISALASAPNAASRRELEFKPLAIRVLASIVAGGIVGLVLTFLHFGVWALVWQAMVQRLVNVSVLWRLVDVPFRFGWSTPHFLELWRYAAPMLLSQTMSWSAAQIPRFILGVYLGASELGLFSLASRIQEIVLQVALSPAFGVARVKMRAYVDDPSGLEAAMGGLLRHMGLLCFPLCIGAAVVMPVLFQVWLDARWRGGVPVAQLLILGVMPYVTHYGLSAALLGMNRQSWVAVNATVQTVATVVIVFIFAPFGLVAASAAIAVRPLATAVIPMAFTQRHFKISASSVLRAQARVFLAALIMGLIVFALDWTLAGRVPPGLLLALLIGAGVLSYAGLIVLLLPDLAAPYLDRLRNLTGS
jgi:O-antigen/teichoic acid export membrane protein